MLSGSCNKLQVHCVTPKTQIFQNADDAGVRFADVERTKEFIDTIKNEYIQSMENKYNNKIPKCL